MAVFHGTFRSKVLNQSAPLNIIIPEQVKEDIPTVYMLHGLTGTQDDYIRFSMLETYATERNFAVIMPFVDKSYFTDMKYGHKYYTYVAKEVVEYSRQILPLSHKREKTFIAGGSMGGYGALKIGLRNPEVFAGIASFSGVTDIHYRFSVGGDAAAATAIWGENYLDELKDTENDISYLVKKLIAEKKEIPWIFQSCGTEDFLYDTNQKFREFMEPLGLNYVYKEGPGVHSVPNFDRWIPYALDYFLKYMEEHK